MGDFPRFAWPPLNLITPIHPDSMGGYLSMHGMELVNSFSSGNPGSNTIYYYPFWMYQASTAVKMCALVGSTANGNMDAGIYDSQFDLLVNSGSVAQAGATLITEMDITDTLLTPGLYYMALQCSSGTGTVFGDTFLSDEHGLVGSQVFIESPGSFGLPTTGTPVKPTSSVPAIWLFGVAFNTLI